MAAIIVRQATKREIFVVLSLEEYVPGNHLLRAVDRYLDLSEFRLSLAEAGRFNRALGHLPVGPL